MTLPSPVAQIVDDRLVETSERPTLAHRSPQHVLGPVIGIGDGDVQVLFDDPRLNQSSQRRQLGRRTVECQNPSADAIAEFIHRAVDAQHAAVDDGDVVGHALDVVEQMRAEQNRAIFVGRHRQHRLDQGPPCDRIEPQCRVVENEQLGLRGQRERQAQAGSLAARKLPGFRLRIEPEVIDDRIENLRVPAGKAAGLKRGALANPHPAIDEMAFGEVSHARRRPPR